MLKAKKRPEIHNPRMHFRNANDAKRMLTRNSMQKLKCGVKEAKGTTNRL
jgi:hypothetical protein